MVMAEESESVPKKRWSCNAKEEALLVQCAELVLPYLTQSELANVSSTCKSLLELSRAITLRRASDASRAFETLPVPFLNTIDAHPYAHFLYTRSLLLPSPLPLLPRQPWGSSVISPSSPTHLRAESVGFVDASGRAASGCDCEACAGPTCPCAGLDGMDDVGRECGPGCRCGPECGNRFTRNGLAVKVRIVRDEKKGWGLKADQFIAKGEFLFEYSGITEIILISIFLLAILSFFMMLDVSLLVEDLNPQLLSHSSFTTKLTLYIFEWYFLLMRIEIYRMYDSEVECV